MSSRLFNEVREKNGLAYEIGSAVKRFNDTGVFLVHAGIDNRKILQAIKLILAELSKSKEDLVTNDELKRAKDFCLGQLALSLEDTMDNMLWLGESMLCLDKVYALQEIIDGINSVTRQDIRKVAQTILQKDHLNLALIGPLKEEENSIRQQMKI